MWMVNPRILCSKHLSGEHGELHKHKHNFVKCHSMTGRIKGNALEPLSLQSRHDELERELNRRQKIEGRKQTSSPFEAPDVSYLPSHELNYKVKVEESLFLLLNKCPACLEKYNNQKLKKKKTQTAQKPMQC